MKSVSGILSGLNIEPFMIKFEQKKSSFLPSIIYDFLMIFLVGGREEHFLSVEKSFEKIKKMPGNVHCGLAFPQYGGRICLAIFLF